MKKLVPLVTVVGLRNGNLLRAGYRRTLAYSSMVEAQEKDGILEIVAWEIPDGAAKTLKKQADGEESQARQCDHVCAHEGHPWIDNDSRELHWCYGQEEDRGGVDGGLDDRPSSGRNP